jgi:cell division septation protein DedD
LTTCPNCGAGVDPHQEYCLECGARLDAPGLVPTLAAGWRRRLRWYPGDWVWPSLLALVVAALAGGAAVWWTRDAESAANRTLVGDTSQLPTVASVTVVPTAPVPTAPTSTTRTTTTGRPAERRQLVEWPKGRSGWMLVLSSLPTAAGRDRAVAKARQALAAGLPQVGVLDSSRFSSLHPGYFVVFSGIYETLAEAQDAASKAASSGYNAYPRRVTS